MNLSWWSDYDYPEELEEYWLVVSPDGYWEYSVWIRCPHGEELGVWYL